MTVRNALLRTNRLLLDSKRSGNLAKMPTVPAKRSAAKKVAPSAVAPTATAVSKQRPRLAEKGRTADVRDAALTLFFKLGYHGTSMKDIASALRMQAPSLYNHVAAKQDLLRDIALTAHERANRELRSALASSDDVIEQLRRAVEVHVHYHTKYPREWRVASRELEHLEEPTRTLVRKMRHEFEGMMIALLERGAREGRFSITSPRLTAYAILRMSSGVGLWYREGGPFSDSEIAYYFGDLALRMVGVSVDDKRAIATTRSSKKRNSGDSGRNPART
jgi:AcrR family transcriptional regulator